MSGTIVVAICGAVAAVLVGVISAVVTWAIGTKRIVLDREKQGIDSFTATIAAFEKLIHEQRLLLVDTRTELQASRLCNTQLGDRVMVLQAEVISQKVRIEVLERENVALSVENLKLKAEIAVLRESVMKLQPKAAEGAGAL
jgi:regulator of replication initiation timing